MNKRAKQLATLSVKNLRSHPWLYTKLALAFAVLVFLLCLFSAYALALHSMQKDVLDEHVSANKIVSTQPIDSGLPIGTESIVGKRFDAYPYDDEEETVEDDDIDDGIVIEPYVPLNVTLTVDGTPYDREEYYNFNKIFAYDKLLTTNDSAELIRASGSDDVLVGRMPSSSNEAVVAERFLNDFGLTSEQVLGKTLSLKIIKGESIVQVPNFVVCGVLKRTYSDLSCYESYFFPTPYLIFSAENTIFEDVERVTDVYVYSLPHWLTQEEVSSITSEYECRFLGEEWLDDMVRLSHFQSIATKLFVVVGGALGCSVVLMIFLMMDKLIAVFGRDCGILLSCGLQLRDAKLLLLTMIAWICLFAIVIAALLTSAGVLGINAAIYNYFYMEITMSVITVLALFGIGIAAVMLVAFIYYLYAVARMKRRTIKDFLNTHIN